MQARCRRLYVSLCTKSVVTLHQRRGMNSSASQREQRLCKPRGLGMADVIATLEADNSQVLWVGNLDRCAVAAHELAVPICCGVYIASSPVPGLQG